MTPQITINQDSVVTILLVILVIIFLVAERLAKEVINSIYDSTRDSGLKSAEQINRFSRAVSAGSIMSFVSFLLKTALGLALALGLAKAFSDLARLVLPERTLGLVVFISYCGLVTVFRVLEEDFRHAISRLF